MNIQDQIKNYKAAIASCQEAMNEIDDLAEYDNVVRIIKSIDAIIKHKEGVMSDARMAKHFIAV